MLKNNFLVRLARLREQVNCANESLRSWEEHERERHIEPVFKIKERLLNSFFQIH